MTAAELTAEAHAMLARHAAERVRVGDDAGSAPYAHALAAVHQAEREQLARTMLALLFPASKRPPVC